MAEAVAKLVSTDSLPAGGEIPVLFRRVEPVTASIPAVPGTYALVMSIETAVEIEIGALGRRALAAGTYVYCGSALGPGGLRARVSRHLRTEKARRWHVDYLLAAATVSGVWVCESPERLECVLAAALAARDGSTRPIPGFGSSDCGCPGHLVRVHKISPDPAPESIL